MNAVVAPSSVDELLEQADALRVAGRGTEARHLYEEAVARCRAQGDLARWTRSALGQAAVHVYGTDPGKLPAELYDLLARTVDDADRARLGAALARCWAYAGHSDRARAFADEAVAAGERSEQPQLLADCLDAALACHWGPDELGVRIGLASRLDDVAAHVLDATSRLQAHMWGLQVGCESLDIQSIHRHIRAMERIGEESPRALFFAASRRLMLDLLRGRTDTAAHLIAVATAAAEQASLADAWMVLGTMRAYEAVQTGDTGTCAEVAAAMQAFALEEGTAAVCAETAFMWLAAGRADDAREMLHMLHGPVLDDLPSDVDWLLTLQCSLDAALGVNDRYMIEKASRLLEPYAGRAVFNAGAVMFHGLTDDTLARAASVLGDDATAVARRSSALATYERLGASWWRDRLASWRPPRPADPRTLRLSPTGDGFWLVGTAAESVPVRALKGYTYLRELLQRPGTPIPAIDLVARGSGSVEQSGVGPLLDPAALAAYRGRLNDLEADIDEAANWSDEGRREALEAERDALLHEIMAATGLGGRERVAGSSRERARIAATKSLTAAISRAAAVDERVGRHLQRTIQTGTLCTYEPDRDQAVEWLLD
jgi:hypothetical protein